ncbi:MAG: CoA transferase [Pseudomonadota bacterium]
MGEQLFSDLLVLDVGSFVAGPAAATILADFGANVIKVEPPGAGDPYRRLGDLPGMPDSEHNYCWMLDSRNKKSLSLDLKSEQGYDILIQLVQKADIFVTNYPFPVRKRLKLEYENLASKNDKLIYASLTPYGEKGAEANRSAFDSTAWWARSGMMDSMRLPENPPNTSAPGMGDHPTAMSLYAGIVSALYKRTKTGKGAYVSTSLMANGIWSNGILAQAELVGATFHQRQKQSRNALGNLYATSDERWFLLLMLSEEKQWPAFSEAVGHPEWQKDPRFAEISERRENAPILADMLSGIFRSKAWDEWRDILTQHGITFGVVGKLADHRHDPQMFDSGTLIPMTYSDNTVGLTVSSPVWIEGEEKLNGGPAPEVGEHTQQILGELGLDESTLITLKQQGII